MDPKDKLETYVTKWKRISKVVMNACCFYHMQNDLAYKDKWESILGNFKWIFDYMSRIGHDEDYWTLSFQEKTSFHLPHQFGRETYELIWGFMGIKPIFKSLHVQDLLHDEKHLQNEWTFFKM